MLKAGERIDYLQRQGLEIIQSDHSFCFSIDAVLLAHFATVRSGDKIVDLGTGSGVIPLLLSTRAARLKLWGLELHSEVADRASRSVVHNNLSEQIEIVHGDIREVRSLFPAGGYDVVTSNPPYLPMGTGEISEVDTRRMARHEVFCTLSDVFLAAAWLLRTGGRFAMVHRPSRLSEIVSIATAHRMEFKSMRLVYPKDSQNSNMVLLEAIKNGKPGLVVGPPIFIHEADGAYTEFINKLYAGGQLK